MLFMMRVLHTRERGVHRIRGIRVEKRGAALVVKRALERRHVFHVRRDRIIGTQNQRNNVDRLGVVSPEIHALPTDSPNQNGTRQTGKGRNKHEKGGLCGNSRGI